MSTHKILSHTNPLDHLCTVLTPEQTTPHLSPCSTRKLSRLDTFRNSIFHKPDCFKSPSGDIQVQRARHPFSSGVFGSVSAATGARTQNRTLVHTNSTSHMIVKKQHSPRNSPEVLLVLREYWLGEVLSTELRADSPCPKPLSLQIITTPDGTQDITTKLLQSRVFGTSLGKLMFEHPESKVKGTGGVGLESPLNGPLFDFTLPPNTLKIMKYRILFGLASQLQKFHLLKINHNDLNPYNIIVDYGVISSQAPSPEEIIKAVKIVDLGRSIFCGEKNGQFDPLRDELTGIRFYMSPNQCGNLVKSRLPEITPLTPLVMITSQDEMLSFGLLMIHLLSGYLPEWSTLDLQERTGSTLTKEVTRVCSDPGPIKDDPAIARLLMGLIVTDLGEQISEADVIEVLLTHAF